MLAESLVARFCSDVREEPGFFAARFCPDFDAVDRRLFVIGGIAGGVGEPRREFRFTLDYGTAAWKFHLSRRARSGPPTIAADLLLR